MIKEDPFVELAILCSRACHALGTVDDLGGFGKHIEDFERCVVLACHFLLVMTSGSRIVSNIESAAEAHADCAIGLRECPCVPTKDCINTWRKELCEILSCFGVRRCQLAGDV